MMNTHDIQKIQIILQADERLLLHILLSSDGAIQRLGSGRLDNKESQLMSDNVGGVFFEDLLKSLPADFWESEGRYSDPNLRGQRLGLSISVIENGHEHSFQIVYGSESSGPPDDIVAFVVRAKDLTEEWYQGLKK